ncbi:LysR family transcriptional regulator [Pseudoalteromonas sp. XMcav2-N]|nr:LysR family transcriptional regulator [Pseudoalteromonas sp. XMcav2-N]
MAAIDLNTTPSALSKSLKKLESSLGVLLFDRVGKQLVLNKNGARLLPEAIKILDITRSTQIALAPTNTVFTCRVSAPAILQYRWISLFGAAASGILIEYESDFEMEALNKVKQGLVDVALTTSLVRPHLNEELEAMPIGELTLELAVGKTHPLACKHSVTPLELSSYPFAVPNTSPFCGEFRGSSCDGWYDDTMNRQIKWIVNDYAALCELVKNGLAIAYLPDYMLSAWQLRKLTRQCDKKNHTEQVFAIYRRNVPSWIKSLVEEIHLDSGK